MTSLIVLFVISLIGLFLNEFFHYHRNEAVRNALLEIINNPHHFKEYYPHLPSYDKLVYFHIKCWKTEDFIELAKKNKT